MIKSKNANTSDAAISFTHSWLPVTDEITCKIVYYPLTTYSHFGHIHLKPKTVLGFAIVFFWTLIIKMNIESESHLMQVVVIGWKPPLLYR